MGNKYKRIKAFSSIDCHTHIGVSLKNYICSNGCYCQSINELLLKMQVYGIGCSIVFPYPENTWNRITNIKMNDNKVFIAEKYEYELANLNLLNEIKERKIKNLLPFIIVNPNQNLEYIYDLIEKYNQYIYGIKIHTTSCECNPSLLSNKILVDVCEIYNLPLIFHTRACEKEYNYLSVLDFAKRNPNLRVCISHLGGFDENFIENVKKYNNVFFDVSPLHYLCYYASIGNKKIISENKLNLNYINPEEVFVYFYNLLPNKILWGTDTPFGVINKCEDSYYEEIKIYNKINDKVKKRIIHNVYVFLKGER